MHDMYEGYEKKYQATIWGKGIRKRCRKEETIIERLDYAQELQVTPDMEEAAREKLRDKYRSVSNARIVINEVHVSPVSESGYFTSCEPWDAPKIEKQIYPG